MIRMKSELMDVVNERDEVVDIASQGDVYQKNLPHRIVHVLLFNEAGEMALQLRSKTKSFCPSHWSTAVGGHVQSGESYEQAALREMKEEIGIILPLNFAFKDWYSGIAHPSLNKFLATFTAHYGGALEVNPEEVEFFSLAEIKQMLARGEKFHPELVFLLEKHFFKIS